MKYCVMILLTFLLMVAVTLGQAQQPTAAQERIHKLEKIIRDQNACLDDLEKQLEKSQQQSREYTEQIVHDYLQQPQAEEAEAINAGYESKGFFVRSADGNVELYMSGMIQMGLAIFENNTYDNNNVYPNGVSLAFDAYFMKSWHGRVQLNFWNLQNESFQSGKGDAIALWDAYIEYMGIPEVNVRVGQFHVPFTIEGQYEPNQGISIWSEPYIRSWSHGRDPGLMLLGLLNDTLEYKVSAHNGEGSARMTNNSDEMLFAGSLRVYPFTKTENANTFLHFGVLRSRDDSVHANGDINAASLYTPWGRTLFDGAIAPIAWGDDYTQGWKTGVDTGLRLDFYLDSRKIDRIWFETEFMYMNWQRSFATARLPYLNGYGFTIAMLYMHNITPEIEGAGIFPMIKFSYSDIDNKHTNDAYEIVNVNGRNIQNDIQGQRVWTYTFGLGYSFNKHVTINANWVIVEVDENLYGSPKKTGKTDSMENGWFFQMTAQW